MEDAPNRLELSLEATEQLRERLAQADLLEGAIGTFRRMFLGRKDF